jgi:CheY-like chemotaxis protein
MAGGDRKQRVLVVDDDQDIRDVIQILLEEHGYEVVLAKNGLQALETLCGSPSLPVLILLDLWMPVMNGWQFRERQLADPRIAAIPVVVFSADSAAVRDAPPGVAGCLSKPMSLGDILDAIDHALHPRGDAADGLHSGRA